MEGAHRCCFGFGRIGLRVFIVPVLVALVYVEYVYSLRYWFSLANNARLLPCKTQQCLSVHFLEPEDIKPWQCYDFPPIHIRRRLSCILIVTTVACTAQLPHVAYQVFQHHQVPEA